MISVIICSTNPDRLARVTQNVNETIGEQFEMVVRDNRGSSDGICKVYNELAQKASGDYLCFIHEDVKFDTQGWGKMLARKADEKQVGIVGLVGSAMKSQNLSGMMHPKYGESNVADIHDKDPIPHKYKKHTITGLEFAPVIIVDGVCLFIKPDVLKKIGGFDQHTFQGFHLYDLDISTAATVAGYTNYVCHTIRFGHFSRGNYNNEWYEASKIYQEKWAHILPLYVNKPSPRQIKRDEEYIHFNITYHLLKRSNLPPQEIYPRIRLQLRKHPLYHKTYYQIYRFLRYKSQYKKRNKNNPST